MIANEKKVVKFGGSSLASAEQFMKVYNIIKAEESRKYVVPSAPGKRFKADEKVTDLLIKCQSASAKEEDYLPTLEKIKERYYSIIEELGLNLSLEGEFELIANKLKVTVGSLTIAINRLVQKGYLLRTRHEMDHRIILVSTTQKGKKVLKAHDKFHEDILGLVLEGVTLQQAMKVMTQFALVLENYYDPKTIVASTEKKGTKK